MKKYDITIVGLGATGISFLSYLDLISRKIKLSNINVSIISEKDTISLGKAFNECDDIHLVNTETNLLSLYENDPLNFKHWLKKRGYNYKHPQEKYLHPI